MDSRSKRSRRGEEPCSQGLANESIVRPNAPLRVLPHRMLSLEALPSSLGRQVSSAGPMQVCQPSVKAIKLFYNLCVMH